MEANKGEAIRAANVAQKFIGQGDLGKAKKFLEKSIKLYPLPEAQALLHKINSGVPMATNAGKENNPNGTRSTSAGVRQRKAAKKEEPAAPVRPFTKEQQAAVNRIKQSKDFYDILGVARNADDATIKKAYRKLALKLHPDKNSAPGADEAFKEVSRAWTVLSDSHKRAHYDRFGSDEAPARQYQQRYHDEIDPEEIFNMFFGSGFGAAMGGPGVRMYRFGGDQRRRNGGGGHQQQHQGESGIFSMEKSGSYPVMRKTKTAGVYPDIPFFVDTSFNARYARDRRTLSQIERQVEGEYVKVLKRGCQLDRKAKDRAVYEARRSRNAQRLKQANELGVPRCEQLDKVQSHVGY